MSEPIIQMTGVSKWYGDFKALTDINFTVNKGDKIVVCGPSGSGKSTMIRTLNWLEAHQKGTIIVNGTKMHKKMKNVEEVRMDVGMVFQHFNLFPHMSVVQNLMAGPMWVRGIEEAEARKTAMKFLERVRIPEQAEKFPGTIVWRSTTASSNSTIPLHESQGNAV